MRTDKPILIFTIEFPPHLGGAATYARNLAIGLSGIGYKVKVLTIGRPRDAAKQEDIDRRLQEEKGIAVKRIRFVPKLYLLVMARALQRCIKTEDFGALIIADSGAQKSSAFFSTKRALPSWTVFHGSEADNYFGKSTLMLRLARAPSIMRKFFVNLSCCVAVSEWIRAEITKKLPELVDKCHVIHHGVEIDQNVFLIDKKEALSTLGVNQDAHVIFSASRLIAEKGQDVLIRAFANASRYVPTMHLLIAGEGPAKEQLQKLAVTEGVADKVTFMGKLPRNMMLTCYRACDVFAQPSRYPFDSFGLVYLEANACGRAVIAGKVAGIPEAVEDGISGFLIDPLDEDRLCELLLRLVQDPALREELERSALERVSTEFPLERMAQKTADLIFPEH